MTAPNPVTNAELSKALGRALHRPAVLPVPALALKVLYGEMATIVPTGQRGVPARLSELGYSFRHPELEAALRDVLAANSVHLLKRRAIGPRPRRGVRVLLAATNLETLTPPWLRFRVLDAQPIEMCRGTRIEYRLRLHGLPLRWVSRIEECSPAACSSTVSCTVLTGSGTTAMSSRRTAAGRWSATSSHYALPSDPSARWPTPHSSAGTWPPCSSTAAGGSTSWRCRAARGVTAVAILWLRRDLRLRDNPALAAARGRPGDPGLLPGHAAAQAATQSGARTSSCSIACDDLDGALRELGSAWSSVTGFPSASSPAVARELGARCGPRHRRRRPYARRRDDAVSSALAAADAELALHPGLFVVDDLERRCAPRTGGPYTVFTPYHRAWLRGRRARRCRAPRALPAAPGRQDAAGTCPP